MRKLITIVIVFGLATTTYAQPGIIDNTFNPTDIGFGNGDGSNNTVYTSSIQNDGKLIIGGYFTSYNGTERNHIARLNVDGTLDGTFNPGSGTGGPTSFVYTTSIQSDGQLIIGGGFSSYNGIGRNHIARLNVDGSLDGTFNPGTGVDYDVRTTSIQRDGQLIIGGYFTTYNGTTRNGIARINVDGTLDTTFNPGTGANNTVYTTCIQNDGKIIISGGFSSYNGTARNGIARLNIDGTLDTTFIPGTGVNSSITTTSIQNDGKIVIGGYFTVYNGNLLIYVRYNIARLNADGTLDSAFNQGTGPNSFISTTSVQSDGQLVIGGDFTSFNGTGRNHIARLNADGTLDSTFNPGSGADFSVRTISFQSAGQLIIGGDFFTYNGNVRNHIARLNIEGTLDDTFNPVTGANDTVSATCIQSDGKIIIGGDFTVYNGTTIKHIARLNIDGTLDSTFNPGTGAGNSVATISVQNDGQLIIGGNFTSYNGTAKNRIARLNVDGTLEGTFNQGTGASKYVFTTSIQSDGKIIIGGDFTSYNGTEINRIARLNVDGTLDNTFNPGTGADNYVYATSIQSDGKIIIGGYFSFYNGTARNRIARLNIDGTLDSTFNPGIGANGFVSTTSIQSDGQLIIGGSFTTYNGTERNYIARLNEDGTLDGTFNYVTGANSSVRTTAIQGDGKIIIGGYFSSYNGTGRSHLARLNIDGTLDETFNPGTGTNSYVGSTSIQSDGQLIIGGFFNSYNGTGRNRIARINCDSSLARTLFDKDAIVIYPNPSKGIFNINTASLSGTKNIILYTVLGKKIESKAIITSETTIDISGQPKGVYLYKFYNDKAEIQRGKLIVE